MRSAIEIAIDGVVAVEPRLQRIQRGDARGRATGTVPGGGGVVHGRADRAGQRRRIIRRNQERAIGTGHSGTPPTAVAMAGTPAWIASRSEIGVPSVRELRTYRSKAGR